MSEFSRKKYAFLYTLHVNTWGLKKHYNFQQESTSSSPRRPTTLQGELSLKRRMQQKYTKQNQVNLTNASKTSEKDIGGSSVLAVDHKKNEIQRPRTVSHAR